MGGQGSGRPPSIETMIKRTSPPPQQPVGSDIWLPDFSGLQAVKKTDAAVPTLPLDHTDSGDITNTGTNTHAQIDTHIASGAIHFTEASIDHDSITNTHNLTTDIDHDQLTNFASNEHFTEASIDHTAISNIGTNSHSQIDTHIASGSIHFTEASIDHTAITNIGTNSHAQIDTHIADTSDPHGSALTQTTLTVTNLTITSGAVTGDQSTADTAYIPMVLFNTDATPPTASNFPRGTIYIQYTA